MEMINAQGERFLASEGESHIMRNNLLTNRITITILSVKTGHSVNEMINRLSLFIAMVLAAALCIARATARDAEIPLYDWGTLLVKIKQTLPADEKYIEFTPSERPKYKNRMLNYITAIDNNIYNKIKILRLTSSPRIDYLFVNNKLYTMVENWGTIGRDEERRIRVRLTHRFGNPTIQRDRNFYIYSYNTDKTKVFWYLMKAPDAKSDCMIYYYPRQLFRMLISE
jgi:hypothetical protein